MGHQPAAKYKATRFPWKESPAISLPSISITGKDKEEPSAVVEEEDRQAHREVCDNIEDFAKRAIGSTKGFTIFFFCLQGIPSSLC